MIIDCIWLIVGLALIIGGASVLTDGAAAIAKKLGLSDLIIGLTIVAFGTSAPELAISIIAAVDGNPSMAVGNVVGSNIFNILAIIGIVSIIRPLTIEKSVLQRELPMVLLTSIVLWIMGSGEILDHSAIDEFTRSYGLILLVFFILFLCYTFATAKSVSPQDATSDPSAVEAEKKPDWPIWKSAIFVIGGLAALVFGGDKFVEGASGVAKALGMSDAMVGITIVAAGTSLPELASSVAAAVKGHASMAVGNVVGSNIFNILLVLGMSATIAPLPLGGVTQLDLLVVVGSALLFCLCGKIIGTRKITRAEGAFMFLCYCSYIAFLISQL